MQGVKWTLAAAARSRAKESTPTTKNEQVIIVFSFDPRRKRQETWRSKQSSEIDGASKRGDGGDPRPHSCYKKRASPLAISVVATVLACTITILVTDGLLRCLALSVPHREARKNATVEEGAAAARAPTCRVGTTTPATAATAALTDDRARKKSAVERGTAAAAPAAAYLVGTSTAPVAAPRTEG